MQDYPFTPPRHSAAIQHTRLPLATNKIEGGVPIKRTSLATKRPMANGKLICQWIDE